MTSRIRVTKMHGARNDFVVFDRRRQDAGDLEGIARRICDRRAGIGADGFIVIERSSNASVAMRTFNPDGSEAEICGNGLRCAAQWLDEAGEGARIALHTAAGMVNTEIITREPSYRVRVEMPAPRIVARELAGLGDSFLVDTGNPHLVLFRSSLDAENLETLGRTLQDDARFPAGVNVHVAVAESGNRLRVRHWERGAGATQACGTGAVASAVAAIDAGRVSAPVEVLVPGGTLTVEFGNGKVALVGPSERVFDTEIAV